MGGFEVCRQLKNNSTTHNIPVIFVTAKNAVEDETLELELGAVDYISKPINPPILLARVKTQWVVKQIQDFLRNQKQFPEKPTCKKVPWKSKPFRR